MERKSGPIVANLNLKMCNGDFSNLEVIDELSITNSPISNELFVKYFKDLYDELSQRGDSVLPGLAKTIFHEVFFIS